MYTPTTSPDYRSKKKSARKPRVAVGRGLSSRSGVCVYISIHIYICIYIYIYIYIYMYV